MAAIIKIRASDLILQVKHNYDPTILDLSAWESYLDCLCGTRDYQKEAIKTAIIYMASGCYRDINQLAAENYAENHYLQEKYKTKDDLIKRLPLPDKLSGVIDLATATGKSYVMYGIAQIMLSLGLVKRVLLLCPSVTIERELRNKFQALSAKKELKAAIPSGSVYESPSMIDASVTICPGDICIENIHAVYDKSATSIKDSFAFGGEDTLVLNDEVHHAYNSSGEADIRKWKGFLSGGYHFRYVMGFTGTAYVANEYFSDVIYRYSLKQAIEDKVIKSIEYISKTDESSTYEKFQMIYDNHLECQRKHSLLKPLSIFVTKDIKSAVNLSLDFIDFLVNAKNIAREDAEKKVIVVTSAPKHKKNTDLLLSVDDPVNPVEWIISVSMLTEGWDAKNIFQIVPWEDRAFNSKLLIAQVLGRGLRIPEGYLTQPRVRVFNHASWSKNIQTLVDEVLDIDLELTSRIVKNGQRSMFNFDIHTLDYTQEERTFENPSKKQRETFDLTKKVVLISQTPQDKKKTEYEDVNRRTYEKTTVVQREMIHVNDIVNRIIESFRGRALEAKLVFPEGQYEKDNLPSVDVIRSYILDSMSACGIKGEYLSSENANKIYGKFTGLLRRKPATPVFVKKGGPIRTINTSSMKPSSKSASMLTREITIFTSNDYRKELTEDELTSYLTIRAEMRTRQIHEENTKCFKTPISIVFTQGEPELRFTEMLVSEEISPHITAWIKSRDVGFYSIEYQLNKGSAIQEFNPDFFILSGDNVAVVEIKADRDDSSMNCAKYKAAKRHFELLNKALEAEDSRRRYFFYFLSPIDFTTFSDYLSDGRLFNTTFHSKLMEILEKKAELISE